MGQVAKAVFSRLPARRRPRRRSSPGSSSSSPPTRPSTASRCSARSSPATASCRASCTPAATGSRSRTASSSSRRPRPALIVVYDAEVTRLIQLYIVGVFVSFTLSQIGMVRHWNAAPARRDGPRGPRPDAAQPGHQRRRRWRCRGTVLVVVLVTKFTHGAGYAIAAMAVLFVLMTRDPQALRPGPRRAARRGGRHQAAAAARRGCTPSCSCRRSTSRPCARSPTRARRDRRSSRRSPSTSTPTRPGRCRPSGTAATSRCRSRRSTARSARSPGRSSTTSSRSARGNPRDLVVVYIPEYVLGHWWEQVLHNQSALRLKARLLFTPGRHGVLRAVAARVVGGRRGADGRPGRRRRAPRRGLMPAEHGPGLAVGDVVEVDVTADRPRRALRRPPRGPGALRPAHAPRRAGAAPGSPRPAPASASCARTPSRCSPRRPTGSTPPCPWSGPGACGGCDLQHVALPRQRALKADVVREQMARLAHLEVDVEVEPVPGDVDGLDWRTRVEFAVDARGPSRPAPAPFPRRRAHRPLPHRLRRRRLPPGHRAAVGRERGRGCRRAHRRRAARRGRCRRRTVPVVARARRRHPGPTAPAATRTLDRRVRGVGARLLAGAPGRGRDVPVQPSWRLVAPRPGERALDLYAGVGLFTAALADAVGPTGQVLAVESDAGRPATPARTSRAAPTSPSSRPASTTRSAWPGRPVAGRRGSGGAGRARRPAPRWCRSAADVVVLDPPRTGAGRGVCAEVAALRPRVVVYVACDPAALARDTAYLAEPGTGSTACAPSTPSR